MGVRTVGADAVVDGGLGVGDGGVGVGDGAAVDVEFPVQLTVTDAGAAVPAGVLACTE
jgi:hypothetical protein